MPHDIGYSGPPEEYIPPQGYNLNPNSSATVGPKTVTYASVNYLNQIIATLVDNCTTLLDTMIASLSSLALVVTTNPNDANLQSAHEVLWPSTLGTPPPHITYAYYESLLGNTSAAAKAIVSAYEAAARGVTGNNAIDLIPLVQTTLNEANLIQNFVDIHAGDLSDSSQRRTVELFQDWVESAITELGKIQGVYGGSANSLPTSAVTGLSSTDASNVQAALQVNLNQFNSEIKKESGVLQKNFATYQTTFYNNILGPAMNLRNNAIVNTYTSTLPSALSDVVSTTHSVLADQLQAVITDQMRRSQFYTTQTDAILNLVTARDTYRNYINQLSSAGTAVPAGSSGTMIQATDTPSQASYFQSASTSTTSTSNPYLAAHSSLSGLNDPAAHPQYLDKYGDTMYGNLELATPDSISDITALIDGMRPSTHAHTGQDGTVQIHGGDILPSSLTTAAIDTSIQPLVPTGVTLLNQLTDSSSGAGSVDVNFSWIDDPGLLYEIQIAKINTSDPNFATPNSTNVESLRWWNTCYLFRRNITLDIIDDIPLNHPVTITLDAALLIDSLNKIRSDFQDIAVVYTDESVYPVIQYPIPSSSSRNGNDLNIIFNTQTPITASNNGNYTIYYGNPLLAGLPSLDIFIFNPWPLSASYASSEIAYTSPNIQWIDGTSTLANAKATFSFTGTAVRLVSAFGINAGIASIQLDNQTPVDVDFYLNGPTTITSNDSDTFTNLIPGEHTVRVINTGNRNAGSSGTEISISRFEYLGYISFNDLGEETNPILQWTTNTGGVTSPGSI